MNSSFRKRLESLPSYYSAPAGGYAPMPPVMSNRYPSASRRAPDGSDRPEQPDRPVRPGGGVLEGVPRARPQVRPQGAAPVPGPRDRGGSAEADGGGAVPAPGGYGFVSPATPTAPAMPAAPATPAAPAVGTRGRRVARSDTADDAAGDASDGTGGAGATGATGATGGAPGAVGPAAPGAAPAPGAPEGPEGPGAPGAGGIIEPVGVVMAAEAPAVQEPAPQEAPAGTDSPTLPDGVPADGVYRDVDVAIVMESTYPYLKGGVSAVVHDIITGNPELTFGIIHITWDSQAPNRDLYGMPDNVAWVRVLYLAMEEHEEAFLRARPRDLRMGRRKRRELARRLVGSLLALAQEGRTEPLWELITEGLSGGTRRYPVWAILGTQEFMEAYREMMPDLGMSMSDIFWCLRDFFSLAYAVLSEPMPRAAVYHAHTTGYASLLSVAASRLHGTSFLLTEHNLYVRDTVNTLLDRRLDRDIALSDYRTFDVTGRQRMWMAWWLEMGRLCYPYAYTSTYLYPRAITEATELGGDASRAVVIPNGIVTAEFDPSYAARMRALEAIRREGAVNHLWKLVYIARVVPIKGLLDMIDSMKLMVDRGLRVHLDVCGPTEHRPDYFEKCLNRIIELGLESVITIRGTVKVRALLPEFDLFVLPSYNEGLPVVSLETMGAGIPTVSTDVGAVRSVVEEEIVAEDGTVWGTCGTIIEPGDPVLMADEVQRIIQDVDLYAQLCLAARGRVEAAYNLEKVNAAYNRIYRQGGAGKGA